MCQELPVEFSILRHNFTHKLLAIGYTIMCKASVDTQIENMLQFCLNGYIS